MLTVAADPLVALRVSARPRGWRHTDPAREFATIAEPAVEDLVGMSRYLLKL